MRSIIAIVVLVSISGSIYSGWSFYVENQRRKEAELRQVINIANRAQQVAEESLNQGRRLHQLLRDLQRELHRLAQFIAAARKEAQEHATSVNRLETKHQDLQIALGEFAETSRLRRSTILQHLAQIEVPTIHGKRLTKDQASQVARIKAILTEIELQVVLGRTQQEANSGLLNKIRSSASEIRNEMQKIDDAKLRQESLQNDQNQAVQNVETLNSQLQDVRSRIDSIKTKIKRDAQ